MLEKVIHFSIYNKLIVGLLTLVLIIWGGFSLTRLSIDAVPDITNNQVQVITTSPSLAAVEVERLITFPIEITMATIPGIEEMRSFSRFGLSVVTIVFEESIDIYWARQQVNERLTAAQAQIPPGVGKPGMAPVTTGLGEIYQYVVDTEPGYEDQYSAMELRTIQDWIIRRQLLGTPGVAEVSSFGGYLKQYEIAIDPDKLNSLNVSISDIFEALEANNENTGGAYIEKNLSAYFIRSEGLMAGLEDISNTPVRTNANGIPILIRDLAKVQLSHAVRYGATTKDGQGEKVSAIVMMLKGENSAEVIAGVKNKIEEIKATLPEGVVIEPFLDRTKLVDSAIGTVTTNLTEGALIVILILLLFLGNFRAGLIVASVIPLALIFAFGMMKQFGVSGNLMSLGAIDFGLIVDGTVIIVEAIMHHMGLTSFTRKLTQQEMDHEVYQSASGIRKSAAFGEIIILIVYLPILALVGIEGKMFRPMAQTVGFAILGAFILSLTYVPMMSAFFLSKKPARKENISDRMMALFTRLYHPVIQWTMHNRVKVLITAVSLFAVSMVVLNRLGGEFIPTLEEGDFAVETRVMIGSSLENTIQATTQAEKILLEEFPEVQQVVSKIGAGEIPTDPMPIEAADLMIILKDKNEWTSASSREGLADKMSAALAVIPGVTFGFQQPIQMRFNELMTGARQDVVIKIYGEDLEVLTDYAARMGKVVNSVKGASDLYVEEVTGVPQIVVEYNRGQLAKYGLSVREVNYSIQTAFAGASAGLVYEAEKRFDLVVRLDERKRNNLNHVRNLYIARRDGHQIPLYQVAEVTMQEGPYQIQRDNTRRRIIVAFNVRNRDVQSIVDEIQGKVTQSIILAPGYTITYGGQFENLVQAKKRLSIVVPAALVLIFILLYFTFGSIQQGVLIFSAIPLSAIGGIFALWLRDMPFSISAGVGFIALFGVSVLNGIVLIAEFNKLKLDGVDDVLKRVYQGTKVRLRPVLMTASVASLGFLPMALSQSSGAEVQRPLATVVIGGLLSATFLTLVVLPVLYYYFERGIRASLSQVMGLGVCVILLTPFTATGQEQVRIIGSVEEAILIAQDNNLRLKSARMSTEYQEALQKTSFELAKTQIGVEYGQTNSISNDDSRFSISQTFAFPTVYTRRSQLNESKVRSAQQWEQVTSNELIQEIKLAFNQLLFEKNRHRLLLEQDSIFDRFNAAARLRLETGESTLLEKATAEAQTAEIKLMLEQNKANIRIYQNKLQTLLNTPGPIDLASDSFVPKDGINPDSATYIGNPTLGYLQQQMLVSENQKSLERAKLLPDISLGYFNQSFNGPGQDANGNPFDYNSADRFDGFQVGMLIPLWTKPYTSRIKAARIKEDQAKVVMQALDNELGGKLKELAQKHSKFKASIEYYHAKVLPQADLILKQAQRGFQEGEIEYIEYILGLNTALSYQFKYLNLINQYNQVVIEMEFVSGI